MSNPKQFGISHMSFECVLEDNKVYYDTGNLSPTPNCEIFELDQNLDKRVCRKCKFGYSGPVDTNSLVCTDKIQGCDLESYYGGFHNSDFPFHHINCHKCIGSRKIPFLFRDINEELQKFVIEFGDEEPIDSTDQESGHWM